MIQIQCSVLYTIHVADMASDIKHDTVRIS